MLLLCWFSVSIYEDDLTLHKRLSGELGVFNGVVVSIHIKVVFILKWSEVNLKKNILNGISLHILGCDIFRI